MRYSGGKLSNIITNNCNTVKFLISNHPSVRPSDRVRLKKANYANFLGEIVRLERPIVR